MKSLIGLIALLASIACSAQKQKTLPTGWYHVVDSSDFKRTLENGADSFYIDTTPIATAEDFASVKIYNDDAGGPVLLIKLKVNSVSKWKEVTGKVTSDGTRLAFILNDRLLGVRLIDEPWGKGFSAIGLDGYSLAERNTIKAEIEKEIVK